MLVRLLSFTLWLSCFLSAFGNEPPVQFDVVLWFDTEDYILPASDDAALHLARWLTEQKIPATFKVVGEKARTLERRKRTDVIDALKQHEIGYHSNWHSVAPTPAQYLENTHWNEGIAEFTRREKPGYDDVARIFGQKPSCYGQPGSSWGPHSHVALHQWGMRIYFDAGSHINVEGKPFYFGGLLNFYKLSHLIRTGIQYPHELETAKIQFLRSRDQLLTEKGGVISIVYHPCEFVHQQFWDGVNFKNGANPPQQKWQLPPQKSVAETKVAYDNFQQYVLFMKRFPEVRFVTASQVATRYSDVLQSKQWSSTEVRKLAVATTATWEKEGILWVKTHGGILSAAEVFWLATMVVTTTGNPESVVCEQLPSLIQGPGRIPHQLSNSANSKLSDDELLRVAKEVRSYLLANQQIPPEVWVGSLAITPEHYLLQIMQYLERQELKARGVLRPERTVSKEPQLLSKKYVMNDHPSLWKWVIFPPGFSAPQLMAQAKRQAWNLKPAIRSEK